MDITYKKLCEFTRNLVLSKLRNGGGYDELGMWLESISRNKEILYNKSIVTYLLSFQNLV
jgi:hypothetical protein